MPKVIFRPEENPKLDASAAIDLCNRIIDLSNSKAQTIDVVLIRRKIRRRKFAISSEMLSLEQIEESLERLR